MKKHPEPNKTVNGLAQTLVTQRNRYFFLFDLLVFCATPVLAVWLCTDGINNLSGLDYITRFAEPLALYALVATILC